jgi:acyl transferase domain-containing protein
VSATGARLGEMSAIKLALMARKARAEAQSVLRAEPIAVVGMGCRAPGRVETPAQLWELLRSGADAIREVPADRWDPDAWFDPDPAAPGKAATKWGGFLERIDGFDADYFGILPREADGMDPQQRLFLEVAVEALDDAGMPRERLRGSRSGVFVAGYHNDYARMQYADLEAVDSRTLTGTLHSIVANRLSYVLDLRGPSLAIDTACSSSLVAIHLACQSLRACESDLAIAGGVSLMITPEMMVALSKVGFMAADGRCKTFDARADGFGRGEGCGVVVLKRLADAVADADRILAVIRGSAVNQDGHSTLLAAPNGQAQQALIREALANAQLSPERVGFVETHGTGTKLGDPLEVEAIAATVGKATPGSAPCMLGAAKANIGHLEAAAGVVGLIKAVMALRHGEVPRQVGFTKLNPHISLEGTRLAVPREVTPWPRGDQPRCAAVSSFGVGGTNAHVLVEEAPELPADEDPAGAPRSLLLPLSAQSPEALRSLVDAWLAFLPSAEASVADVCHTAAERRTQYDWRLAVSGATKGDLRARLAERVASAGTSLGRRASSSPRVGFVFGGQGPQWYAMGRELFGHEPVFARVIAECDALLRPLSGWSLLEEFAAAEPASRLDRTEVAQPALFALQVGLVALWRSWGLAPGGVVGHSVGEIAALHTAGALSLGEAVRVVWHRGRIMQEATDLGRMAQVTLSETEARDLVRPFGERVSIGAINGPRTVVLSGAADALEAALAALAAKGVGYRMLAVKYAFHSAQMAPFERQLVATLGDVAAAAPSIPFYSTVTGRLAVGDRLDAPYFARNVRDPVRFHAAIGAMCGDGFDAFVEIGPHPVLSASIAECLDERGHPATVTASLRRGRPEREAMLGACAELYQAGWSPDYALVQPGGAVTSLPAYPWQRRRYWIRARPRRADAAREFHPLLGREVPTAGVAARTFEGRSDRCSQWLADHRVFGRIVMPGSAVLGMFAAAADRVLGQASEISSFAMHGPLIVPEAAECGVTWQTVVSPAEAGRVEIALYRAAADAGGEMRWTTIARALASVGASAAAADERDAAVEAVDASAVYARFAELGVDFGPRFRCLRDVRRGPGIAEGSIDTPAELREDESLHALHPALLDAALQLCSIAASRGGDGELPRAVFLPMGADSFWVKDRGAGRLHARVRVEDRAEVLSCEVRIDAIDGATGATETVALLRGMRFARANAGAFAARDGTADLYDLAWHPIAPAPLSSEPLATWLVLGGGGRLGDALQRRIAGTGGRCVRVVGGSGLARTAPHEWTIDPADPEHLRRVVSESGPLRGVLHLWGADLETFDRAGGRVSDDEDVLVVASVVHAVQAATAVQGATPILRFVSRGAEVVTGDEPPAALRPRAAALRGLAGVIAAEHPELDVRHVDLDVDVAADRDDEDEATRLLSEAAARVARPRSVAFRGQEIWASRVTRYAPPSATLPSAGAWRIDLVRPGTFEGLEPRPADAAPPGAGEVRLRVLAAGVNFRDVLVTLGMYPGEPVPLGVECVGVVTEVGAGVADLPLGTRCFGYAPGSFATDVTVPAAFLAPVPEGLGFEQAAGIPVAFLTAHYGLHRLARLARGQRVLIHAGAGGVGMAAVQLALRCGAEVFATAGTEAKREVLRSLGVAHVLDSRSLAFADAIRAATGGEGVHVVLNSLAGDFIPASLGVVAQGGTFLELGKRGVMTTEQAARSRPDVRYHLYDLGAEAQADHGLLRPMLRELLGALADGELRPVPVRVFPMEQIGAALRFMAQAKHVGKIVLRLPPARIPAHAPLVSASATYLITGGLGGIGVETARWLARLGARSLVLTGRRAPSARAREAVRDLEQAGVRVRVFAADAADREAMSRVLDDVRATLPPLRGVIHAAGVADDAVLLHQTWERCRGVLRGKAHGAWVLHELTRSCALDFFVLYSAAGVLLGAPGQAPYAAANAQLDALARARRRLGLPALSVAWGAWADVGMAAELAARGPDFWSSRGLGKIAPERGFAGLERWMRDGAAYGAVLPIDWATFVARLAPGDRLAFSGVAGEPAGPAAAPAWRGEGIVEMLASLPDTRRRPRLLAYLTDVARRVIGLDESAYLDPKVPLRERGLDSLMAVELRNTLARALGRPLPATLVFDYPTLDALVTHLARLLDPSARADRVEVAPLDTSPPAATDLAAIVGLTDQEAEALLLKELEGRPPRSTHGA